MSLHQEQRLSNQKIIFELLQKLTGQSNVLTIPRLFVELFDGDHGQALFLSQLIYWSDKGSNPDGWFYKTYTEWYQETLLSEYKVRKAVKLLESENIVKTKIKKANGNPTLHYKIDPKSLHDWLLKKLKERDLNYSRNEPLKTSGSITKITTKTTTENNSYVSEKRLHALTGENDFLDFYLKTHEHFLGKKHVRVTDEQENYINHCISEIRDTYDIELETWQEEVVSHFENLPKRNNGNILAFLKASHRYFEINPENL